MSENSQKSTAKRHHRHYKTAEIVQAIEKSGGMVHTAARALGCSFSMIQKRAKAEATIQAAIDEQRGLLLDSAEAGLAKAVKAGKPWAIQFTLKTLGHIRGYTQRAQLEVKQVIDWREELREAGINPDEIEQAFNDAFYKKLQEDPYGNNLRTK